MTSTYPGNDDYMDPRHDVAHDEPVSTCKGCGAMADPGTIPYSHCEVCWEASGWRFTSPKLPGEYLLYTGSRTCVAYWWPETCRWQTDGGQWLSALEVVGHALLPTLPEWVR